MKHMTEANATPELIPSQSVMLNGCQPNDEVHPSLANPFSVTSAFKVKWNVWRLWNRNVYNQIERHTTIFQHRYFSHIGFVELILQRIGIWRSTASGFRFCTAEDCDKIAVCKVRKIKKEPNNVVLIKLTDVRCADNANKPKLTNRILELKNDLGKVIGDSVEIDDYMLVWGGFDVSGESNGRMYRVIHMDAHNPPGHVIIYRHDGRDGPARSEDGIIYDQPRMDNVQTVFFEGIQGNDTIWVQRILPLRANAEHWRHVPLVHKEEVVRLPNEREESIHKLGSDSESEHEEIDDKSVGSCEVELVDLATDEEQEGLVSSTNVAVGLARTPEQLTPKQPQVQDKEIRNVVDGIVNDVVNSEAKSPNLILEQDACVGQSQTTTNVEQDEESCQNKTTIPASQAPSFVDDLELDIDIWTQMFVIHSDSEPVIPEQVAEALVKASSDAKDKSVTTSPNGGNSELVSPIPHDETTAVFDSTQIHSGSNSAKSTTSSTTRVPSSLESRSPRSPIQDSDLMVNIGSPVKSSALTQSSQYSVSEMIKELDKVQNETVEFTVATKRKRSEEELDSNHESVITESSSDSSLSTFQTDVPVKQFYDLNHERDRIFHVKCHLTGIFAVNTNREAICLQVDDGTFPNFPVQKFHLTENQNTGDDHANIGTDVDILLKTPHNLQSILEKIEKAKEQITLQNVRIAYNKKAKIHYFIMNGRKSDIISSFKPAGLKKTPVHDVEPGRSVKRRRTSSGTSNISTATIPLSDSEYQESISKTAEAEQSLTLKPLVLKRSPQSNRKSWDSSTSPEENEQAPRGTVPGPRRRLIFGVGANRRKQIVAYNTPGKIEEEAETNITSPTTLSPDGRVLQIKLVPLPEDEIQAYTSGRTPTKKFKPSTLEPEKATARKSSRKRQVSNSDSGSDIVEIVYVKSPPKTRAKDIRMTRSRSKPNPMSPASFDIVKKRTGRGRGSPAFSKRSKK